MQIKPYYDYSFSELKEELEGIEKFLETSGAALGTIEEEWRRDAEELMWRRHAAVTAELDKRKDDS